MFFIMRLSVMNFYINMIMMMIVLIISLFYLVYSNRKYELNIISINVQSTPQYVVSGKFLSFGIDTSIIYSGLRKNNLFSKKLREMTSKLMPAHLRFGGTMSDRLIFMEGNIDMDRKILHNVKGKSSKFLPYFIMDGTDWLVINEFCSSTGNRLLFDLNVLLRNENSWDETNAKKLLMFSKLNNLNNIDWQLGNEPNSFKHVFNTTVTPHQLSKDFKILRNLLQTFYPESYLVGPDTTRPQIQRPDCVKYMKDFLSEASSYIDAIGWHQYYLNGRTATVEDFWNPDTMDLLQSQIDTMNLNIHKYKNKPMWLTETSSAYGGGAPGLSNAFSSSPLWLDKLGISARNGISVVIRQSLIGGNYSLINEHMDPLPDWWISVIFKMLVGENVVSCDSTTTKYQRLYCHCTAQGHIHKNHSVTIFGINLINYNVSINIQGTALQTDTYIDEYLLTAPFNNRTSQQIMLNDEILVYNNELNIIPRRLSSVNTFQMLPYSLGFWVVHNMNVSFCK